MAARTEYARGSLAARNEARGIDTRGPAPQLERDVQKPMGSRDLMRLPSEQNLDYDQFGYQDPDGLAELTLHSAAPISPDLPPQPNRRLPEMDDDYVQV